MYLVNFKLNFPSFEFYSLTYFKSRQHSEGSGGDEEFFFTGFGDLQEYGDSDGGQHGSGRDYDYFEVRAFD